MVKAILLESPEGVFRARLAELDEAAFAGREVLVDVGYSSLNYKDALAITRGAPVVRRFPMVPGIDLAGTVCESADPAWRPGDAVFVNGYGLGESHWGGLAQRACLDGRHLQRLPRAFTPRQTMAIGTAGYTAMLCVMALEHHGITPERGEVLVTGASGGVGSYAVALLAMRGYRVTASSGRPTEWPRLKALGAAELMDRQELAAASRPLQRERWAAAIDTVGSHTLANVCAGLHPRGVVAACGMAQGLDFPSSMAPFILRGITLVGIDSAQAPMAERESAWGQLASVLPAALVDGLTRESGLKDVIQCAHDLLDGTLSGRIVVNVNA